MFTKGTIIEVVNKSGEMSWAGTGYKINKGDKFFARIEGKKSRILYLRNRLGYKDYLATILTVPTSCLENKLDYNVKIAPEYSINGV